MKSIFALLIVSIVSLNTICSQERFVTKTGEIKFEASIPSFEEVKAKNENVSAILNANSGEFASLALVKGFRFKMALMEEHFNENYMESSKYPKATFKGKIKDFDVANLTSEERQYLIIGSVSMHGESKSIELPLMLRKVEDCIEISLDFTLNPADFSIKIPKVVSNKISEEVNVSVTYKLKT